jgi:hypothetical protein
MGSGIAIAFFMICAFCEELPLAIDNDCPHRDFSCFSCDLSQLKSASHPMAMMLIEGMG